MSDLLRVEDLSVHFPVRRNPFGKPRVLKAVDHVSFSIERNSVFGLCGESGSGKTTVGKAIIGLKKRTGGTVFFDGEPLPERNSRELRKRMQIIFQDPVGSLNPQKTIRELLAEPLRIHHLASSRDEEEERILSMLEKVGLGKEVLCRHPHEFSGGQLQRICICRSLLTEPEFLVCDESIASLDVSIQAQIINLLRSLKREFNLTVLFISHNFAVLGYLADRIGVMYLGSIVEIAPASELSSEPLHPYSKALLSVIPQPDPRLERSRKKIVLEGEMPSPIDPPEGCPFFSRCPFAEEHCRQEKPALEEVSSGHYAACFKAKELIGRKDG